MCQTQTYIRKLQAFTMIIEKLADCEKILVRLRFDTIIRITQTSPLQCQ